MRRLGCLFLWVLAAVFLLPALPFVQSGRFAQTAPAAAVQTAGPEELMDAELTALLGACVKPDMEPEALRALAVLFRSDYAARAQAGTPFSEALTPLTEAELKQKFSVSFRRRLEKAAALSQGERLCLNGTPVFAVFHAVSNGHTEDGAAVFGQAVPGILSVASAADTFSPDYLHTRTLDKGELSSLLTAAFPTADLSGDPASFVVITRRTDAGYVSAAQVGGIPVTGQALREALALPSTDMTFFWSGNTCTITTRGMGHGAGLSLYGANALAAEGKSYAEILAHYFPTCTLESA